LLIKINQRNNYENATLRGDYKFYKAGEIDPDYRVPPGITITFDRHSTFAGIVIPNGTKFYNDEYVVKKFVFDPSSGKILLTSIELTAQDGHLFKVSVKFPASYKKKII